MWSIVAREVNFGMAVAYMISAEQRAIETVASMNIEYCVRDISHSDICLNAPYFLRSSATSQWYGQVHHLVGASKLL